MERQVSTATTKDNIVIAVCCAPLSSQQKIEDSGLLYYEQKQTIVEEPGKKVSWAEK
jgi:hypothetical protein